MRRATALVMIAARALSEVDVLGLDQTISVLADGGVFVVLGVALLL